MNDPVPILTNVRKINNRVNEYLQEMKKKYAQQNN